MVERVAVRYVVHQQCSDGTPVIRRRDTPITLLTGSVPDLRFYHFVVLDLDGFGREFHSNSRLGIFVELVLGETKDKVRLSDTRVAQQDDFENELRVVGFGMNGRNKPSRAKITEYGQRTKRQKTV